MTTNNLELYKIFYYVAKTGGMTRAAEQLCISQPAVSQALKQLEDNLGVPLFTRTRKGVLLTGEGEVLYRYVSQGYESIQLGEEKIKQMRNLDYGEIHIGASDMTLEYYLLPFLELFHQNYPGIKVTVTNAPTPQTLSHLKAGRIDFGVVTAPFDETGLWVKRARMIQDIFVAGEKFSDLKGKKLPLKELQSLPIICLEENTSTRHFVDGFLKENDIVLEPEFELATSDMIVQFAKRNLGVGSVVSCFAEQDIQAGHLFRLTFDKEPESRSMLIIRDESYAISVAASKLLSLLEEMRES